MAGAAGVDCFAGAGMRRCCWMWRTIRRGRGRCGRRSAQLPEEMPRTLIFGCLADKQIDEMAQVLLPLFDSTSGDPARARDHVVLAPVQNPRAATVEELLAAARSGWMCRSHAAPHLPDALRRRNR